MTFLADYQDGRSLEVASSHIQYHSMEEIKRDINLWTSFFGQGEDLDFIVIHAYLNADAAIVKWLKEIQVSLQDSRNLPTTIQFSPNSLDTRVSYCKEGPGRGGIIQFIYSPEEDLMIPRREYSFGILTKALAIGNAEALLKKGRKVMLIDLGKDCKEGLDKFMQNIRSLPLSNEDELGARFREKKNRKVPDTMSLGVEML